MVEKDSWLELLELLRQLVAELKKVESNTRGV